MKTIPDLLQAAGVDLAELATAVSNCFAGQSGVVLRNALAEISPPLCPAVGATDAETYRLIGRAEVVLWLLSLSEPEATLGQIIKLTKAHG
jgi:hypothetical protein